MRSRIPFNKIMMRPRIIFGCHPDASPHIMCDMNEIKAIRKELGLTQRAFGERLGMSQSRIAHWENESDTPDTRTMLAMRYLLHAHRGTTPKMVA